MTEKELTDKLNEALEPVHKGHQQHLVDVMDTVKNAFFLGIEVGKSLPQETVDKK